MEPSIKINSNYIIDTPNGETLGKVLMKRLNPFINNSVEYYVHFDSTIDDDWFESDKFKEFSQNELTNSVENNDIRYINFIQFGVFLIKSKYPSKYLHPYKTLPIIFVCPVCMKYMQKLQTLRSHLRERTCSFPGKVVYQNESVKIYEADGADCKLFCQNLSLVAKMFVENKIICYDVGTFVFYYLVLCEDGKETFVGYFSKEKVSEISCNLACILILPPFQRRGFGKLLISLSYKLSVISKVYGSPERPLSNFGLETYLSFWTWEVLNLLMSLKKNQNMTINEVTESTGIVKDDIIYLFENLKSLKCNLVDGKICLHKPDLQQVFKNVKKPTLLIDPRCLLLDG